MQTATHLDQELEEQSDAIWKKLERTRVSFSTWYLIGTTSLLIIGAIILFMETYGILLTGRHPILSASLLIPLSFTLMAIVRHAHYLNIHENVFKPSLFKQIFQKVNLSKERKVSVETIRSLNFLSHDPKKLKVRPILSTNMKDAQLQLDHLKLYFNTNKAPKKAKGLLLQFELKQDPNRLLYISNIINTESKSLYQPTTLTPIEDSTLYFDPSFTIYTPKEDKQILEDQIINLVLALKKSIGKTHNFIIKVERKKMLLFIEDMRIFPIVFNKKAQPFYELESWKAKKEILESLCEVLQSQKN